MPLLLRRLQLSCKQLYYISSEAYAVVTVRSSCVAYAVVTVRSSCVLTALCHCDRDFRATLQHQTTAAEQPV